MNQPKLVRHALILQIYVFLQTKHTEALLKISAVSEKGHPSSGEGFRGRCWRGAVVQRDGEEVMKSCWRYPLFTGQVHRKWFKFLTKGAGVAFIAPIESELTFLISKESYYLDISMMPEPNSAKTLLPGLQHGVKGSPASWSGTCTHCCLLPLLSLVGRNEERKGRKRLWSLLNLADGLCHVRGALTRRDLPKHSSLCLIRRKKLQSSLSEHKHYPLVEEKKSVSEQAICIRAANSLRAWSCRVHGRHSPRSYLETLCFINRAGWGPPLPSPHTPNL